MFKIEKNINIPTKRKCTKYPFPDMDVGDSFIAGEYSRILMSKYSNAARNWAKSSDSNWKFTVRKIGDTIRIWRTS